MEINAWYIGKDHIEVFRWIDNAGTGATKEALIEDFAPIGEKLLREIDGLYDLSKSGVMVLKASTYTKYLPDH